MGQVAAKHTVKKKETHIEQAYLSKLRAEGRPVKNVKYALGLLQKTEASVSYLLSLPQAQDFITTCMSEYGLSARSVNTLITTVSTFYEYLVETGEVVVNPFLYVDRPRQGLTLPKYIPTEADLMKIMNYLAGFGTRSNHLTEMKQRYKVHVVCEFLYGTGVRISEAGSLKTEDVDISGCSARITDSKSAYERICVFSSYTAGVLKQYLKFRSRILKNPDSPLLFGASSYIHPQTNGVLKEACQSLEVEPVTCHSFRHAFAYHLLKAGCDLRSLQDLLGHKRLSSTQVYAKVDTQSLKAVLDRYHLRNK